MSRIFWGLVLLLLLPVPFPGLNLLIHKTFALDKSYQIKGRIVDEKSGVSVEYACIILLCPPATEPLQVTAADSRGGFSFSNLPTGQYILRVTFLGYKPYVSEAIELKGSDPLVKMEPIALQEEIQTVGEVVVTANNRPSYLLDKKTLYVENHLSSAGGTASDLLQQLPSVTRTPDGQIMLQGNKNLLVYIDGKPSSLKGTDLLDNTSASGIKKIELITNPSAKYDASGSAGIINLVTKKNALDGLNGNLLEATDHLGGYSSDLLINYKKNKIALFAGVDHNNRKNRGNVSTLTQIPSDNSLLIKEGKQSAGRTNTGFRAGLDFQANDDNKLSFSANMGNLQIQNDGNWQMNQTLNSGQNDHFAATDHNDRNGHYGGADFSFDHRFGSKGGLLSLSGLWNDLNYHDLFENRVEATSSSAAMFRHTNLDKNYDDWQLSLDYASPEGKKSLWETGYKYSGTRETENYQSEITTAFLPNTTIQESHYNGTIHAGYGSWQYKSRIFSLKAGLRAEYLNRSLQTKTERYPRDEFDLYPSLNSSFKIDSLQELQFSYSRRTDLIKTTQLDPLPRWYDFYNVRSGNPNLKNEKTNKWSLDYLSHAGKVSLTAELYYYETANKIELIRSVLHDNILGSQYENRGSERTGGLELIADWCPSKWLRFNEKADYITSSLQVTNGSALSQKRYQQFYSTATADFIFSPNTLLELDFSYFGPSETTQTSVDEFFLGGITFRKTFLDRKLTFSLTCRDFLGLYKQKEFVSDTTFSQHITTTVDMPFRFSLSYKFNHYKREERKMAKMPISE
ncbi:MAG: TonB-dependent receptor family protein [Marinilabiliales bacterium]|nr:TonB-dependent receptor family protein [Marinilabiliales bacterium]